MPLNLISYLYNLHKLRKNQRNIPAELIKLQENKLKVLLRHAYNKVDYYKRLFDRAGINPEDIKTIYDLNKIPITSRNELQVLTKNEIIAKGVVLNKCINLRTSGSTGMPLDIFASLEEIIFRWLLYRRMYFENGGRLADKELMMSVYKPGRDWFQNLGILEGKFIHIFDDLEVKLKTILEFKPDIIRGYAATLKDLAVEIQRRGITGVSPRIIFSTAELLTRKDREFISSVFKAELFDYYCCNECGPIAWECKEHLGYHINIENVIIEFMKENGAYAKAGEEGEIIITSLSSFTMPFIRYRLGDTGIPSNEECPCGLTLPLMKVVVGRSNDYIVLPGAKTVSPYHLTCEIENIAGIMKYQVLQEEIGKIKIKIVKDKRFTENTIIELKKTIKQILSNDMEIEIVVEDDIHQVNERAKFNKVIYRIKNNA